MRRFISIIVSITLALCVPLLGFAYKSSQEHGGLVCYCCLKPNKQCRIQCTAPCCKTVSDNPIWIPDMITGHSDRLIHLNFIYLKTEKALCPECIYLKIQPKPPPFAG
jgi:hypothetical protein